MWTHTCAAHLKEKPGVSISTNIYFPTSWQQPINTSVSVSVSNFSSARHLHMHTHTNMHAFIISNSTGRWSVLIEFKLNISHYQHVWFELHFLLHFACCHLFSASAAGTAITTLGGFWLLNCILILDWLDSRVVCCSIVLLFFLLFLLLFHITVGVSFS